MKAERSASSSAAPPRFDIVALRDLSGPQVFARGADYAQQGRVRILSVATDEVRAEVSGSEIYDTILAGGGTVISGGCSCPAYEGWGFCKHLVAVALTVNKASPAAIGTAEGAEARLRAYLMGQTKEALAERVLGLARRDGAMWRELDSEVAIAAGDDESVMARLRESIDAAMATDGRGWRGAGSWANDVMAVVDRVATVLAVGRASLALAALDHVFDLAEEALEELDDPDGEAMAVLCEARELHLAACAKAKRDPVTLAAELFERERTSAFDLWTDARRIYAGPLGKRGRAEYRRLAEAAWRDDSRRDGVRVILDAFAVDDGDVDTRIALRAADAETAHDYATLASLCLEAGRQMEALAWAEEGMWRLEDRPDQHLTMLTASLLRDGGRRREAEAMLWKAFERHPDERLHRMLKQTVADAASVADRCVGVIEARIALEKSSYWSPLPGLLIDILLEEGRARDAWRAARGYRCSDEVIERLARATESSHAEEAMQAYADLVEVNIRRTQNYGYEAACRLLGHLEDLRARHGQSAAHAAHLEDLRSRHKAKRNFIRLLGDRAAWRRF